MGFVARQLSLCLVVVWPVVAAESAECFSYPEHRHAFNGAEACGSSSAV